MLVSSRCSAVPCQASTRACGCSLGRGMLRNFMPWSAAASISLLSRAIGRDGWEIQALPGGMPDCVCLFIFKQSTPPLTALSTASSKVKLPAQSHETWECSTLSKPVTKFKSYLDRLEVDCLAGRPCRRLPHGIGIRWHQATWRCIAMFATYAPD